MGVVSTLAACIVAAAQLYSFEPAYLVGIYQVEGGRVGQEVGPNTNGTYDLGPMQINTVWLPQLAKMWEVDERTARAWVRDDPCVNTHVAAWILKTHIKSTGSVFGGFARYHSATPQLGYAYARKVVLAMQRKGLIKDYPPTTSVGPVSKIAPERSVNGQVLAMR